VRRASGRLAEAWGALRAAPAFWLTVAGGVLVAYAAASANHAITWLVQEREFAFRQAAFTAGVGEERAAE
jgi:hypothetical protein